MQIYFAQMQLLKQLLLHEFCAEIFPQSGLYTVNSFNNFLLLKLLFYFLAYSLHPLPGLMVHPLILSLKRGMFFIVTISNSKRNVHD